MKHLLLAAGLLAGLASCKGGGGSAIAENDPVHVAVVTYLSKKLPNHMRCRPVRWGVEKPFRQRDADSVAGEKLQHNPLPADSLKDFPHYPADRRIGTMVRLVYQIQDEAIASKMDSAMFVVADTGDVMAL